MGSSLKGAFLAHLRQIKISGPTDFSENIDAYLNWLVNWLARNQSMERED